MREWAWKYWLSSFACLLFLLVLSGTGRAQEDEIIAGGKGKYEKYCAGCHGHAAKGDGPLSQMLQAE